MLSRDTLHLVIIGTGVLLLASPVAIFAAEIGEPTHEYEAFEIDLEREDFGQPPPNEFAAPFYLDNVVCLDETRSCLIERYIHEEGRIPVDGTIQRVHDDDGVAFEGVYRDRSPYRFAYIDGSFYRVEGVVENGETYLTHRPVSADVAFRRSSVAYTAAAPAFREAVDEGHVTTTADLDTPQVVVVRPGSDDERFYYVHATTSPASDVHGPPLRAQILTYGLSITCFLAGLGLVLRGQRMRIQSR